MEPRCPSCRSRKVRAFPDRTARCLTCGELFVWEPPERRPRRPHRKTDRRRL